jgi:hypothetical protein
MLHNENINYEAKAIVVFLNIIICVTLFFASYAVYTQNYAQDNLKSPIAVGELAQIGQESKESEDKLVVRYNDEQASFVNPTIIESIDIVLYRFPESTPQPMSYYTDLLEIKNTANTSTTISVRIENIHGQENLGLINIWFFENQTDTPTTDIPLSSVKITTQTANSIDLITNYSMKPSSTNFIELAGFASIIAEIGSKITFDFAITTYE